MSPGPLLYFIFLGERMPVGGAAEVGNKAWNLMRMATAGLPVPPGFVLPTIWCGQSHEPDTGKSAQLRVLRQGIDRLEHVTGLGFGSSREPLLVSVRSGAAISMPGMMETVLDVGVNDETVEGLVRLTGNPRLAWDCYRRLIQGYAEVVQGLDTEPFDGLTQAAVAVEDVENETEGTRSSRLAAARSGHARPATANWPVRPSPQSPTDQLEQAADAASSFTGMHRRPRNIVASIISATISARPAVTVQTMVFGNAGGTSGAGVGFTRDPATGEDIDLYPGFFSSTARERTWSPAAAAIRDTERLQSTAPGGVGPAGTGNTPSAQETMFTDVQDFQSSLSRAATPVSAADPPSAKRTPWAALKIACDLVEEGLIQPKEALHRLRAIDIGKGRTKPPDRIQERPARACDRCRHRRRLGADRFRCRNG